jgi:hypothetical protein
MTVVFEHVFLVFSSKYEYDCVGGHNCPVRSAVEGGGARGTQVVEYVYYWGPRSDTVTGA